MAVSNTFWFQFAH